MFCKINLNTERTIYVIPQNSLKTSRHNKPGTKTTIQECNRYCRGSETNPRIKGTVRFCPCDYYRWSQGRDNIVAREIGMAEARLREQRPRAAAAATPPCEGCQMCTLLGTSLFGILATKLFLFLTKGSRD